ncbi:transposase [Paraburkholderia bryophila]|uniref:Transposase n=1 Tax=Paraburkholderia bryophila TaxID=420952 RepID=A0A7Y9WS14_9BURK|nr:transposase [Paraburkholderia bryophila]
MNVPLSDEDWSRVAHLFPEDAIPRFGRPARPARQILDAVLWVHVNGEKWHHLPASFPPEQTCYIKQLQWKRAGVLDQVLKIYGLEAKTAESRSQKPATPGGCPTA